MTKMWPKTDPNESDWASKSRKSTKMWPQTSLNESDWASKSRKSTKLWPLNPCRLQGRKKAGTGGLPENI